MPEQLSQSPIRWPSELPSSFAHGCRVDEVMAEWLAKLIAHMTAN